MADEIISRADARARGLKRYFTGKPCKRGHIAARNVHKSSCVECLKAWYYENHAQTRAKRNLYRERNKDKINAANNAWYHSNKDAILPRRTKQREERRDEIRAENRASYLRHIEPRKKRARAYYEANKAERIDRVRQYQQANREKVRAYKKEHGRVYNQENIHRRRSYTAKRRAQRKRATPLWYNHDDVVVLYARARELSEATGVVYELDHVIPLTNPFVCGLHTADNLQILTCFENRSKGSAFDPETYVHTLPDQTQLRCRTC